MIIFNLSIGSNQAIYFHQLGGQIDSFVDQFTISRRDRLEIIRQLLTEHDRKL